jgi:hypothetical protein
LPRARWHTGASQSDGMFGKHRVGHSRVKAQGGNHCLAHRYLWLMVEALRPPGPARYSTKRRTSASMSILPCAREPGVKRHRSTKPQRESDALASCADGGPTAAVTVRALAQGRLHTDVETRAQRKTIIRQGVKAWGTPFWHFGRRSLGGQTPPFSPAPAALLGQEIAESDNGVRPSLQIPRMAFSFTRGQRQARAVAWHQDPMHQEAA